MDAGPAIALAVGISVIYGSMVVAVIIGFIYANREESGH